MNILLKMTSRERPHQAQQALISWLMNAEDDERIKVAYTLDLDDPHLKNYHLSTMGGAIINIGESTSKIDAINRGVPDDGWDILVNVSDDQFCVLKGWDTQLRNIFAGSLDLSIWSPDGVQPIPNRINTQEIIGREYYDRFKFIYDPRFKSFFCDNLSTEVAAFLDRQIILKTQICRHDHQAASHINIPMDALATRNQKHWKHDEDLYNELKVGGIKKYLLDLQK